MRTILFVECGSSGYGGSFNSLYQTINMLCSHKYRIIVVFFNTTPFYNKLIDKGIECHYFNNAIYNVGSGYRVPNGTWWIN